MGLSLKQNNLVNLYEVVQESSEHESELSHGLKDGNS